MRLYPITAEQLPRMKTLYNSAFPPAERKPFSVLLHKQKQGVADILAIDGGEGFAGFAVVVKHADLAMLEYFAVDPAVRGKGLGGQTLALLYEKYAGSRFFLEIEVPEENAANAEQRILRKAFYLRNGLGETGVTVSVAGVVMELLAWRCSITYDEYYAFYLGVYGKVITAFLGVKEVPGA